MTIYFYLTCKLICSWTQYQEEMELFLRSGGSYLMSVELQDTLEECTPDLEQQRADLQCAVDVTLQMLDKQRMELETATQINTINKSSKDQN